MPPDMPTDETTIAGGVAVSGALLRQVAEDSGQNRDSLAVQTEILRSVSGSLGKIQTSTQTSASITEARFALEAEERQARLDLLKDEAERKNRAQDKLMTWASENWRYVGIVLLLIFYPQVLDQIRALGLLPVPAASAQALVAPLQAAPPLERPVAPPEEAAAAP